jgi:hypothetical protein
MRTNNKLLPVLLAAALGLSFSATVMAADVTSSSEYHQALKAENADFKAALMACPSAAPGRACRKEARNNRDNAVDQIRAQHGIEPAYIDENGAWVNHEPK